MFKRVVIALFLRKEADALKERLFEASAALNRIEDRLTHVPMSAPAEAHKLASDILTDILASADQIHVKNTFTREWEAAAYQAYNQAKTDIRSPYNRAIDLIEKAKVFFI